MRITQQNPLLWLLLLLTAWACLAAPPYGAKTASWQNSGPETASSEMTAWEAAPRLGLRLSADGNVSAPLVAANSTAGIIQLETRSAAVVNDAMVTAGNQPAWLANTNVVQQVVPAGTQYQMVVSAQQAQALARGESWFGGWATPDAVPSQAFARDSLSILPEFKPDVSYVATVRTTAPQTVNSGFAGPLGGFSGGGTQVEFVGGKNLQLVGQPQPLPLK